MVRDQAPLTGVERSFDARDIIVSKTDLTGKITYCNRTFLRIAGFEEAELIGTPHAILRHPDMPRCVFKLLWDSIASGRELFAYVINRCKNGDHYWVLAHVTPTKDSAGAITGYHSSRRLPKRDAVDTIAPLYRRLLDEENRQDDRKAGLAASHALLRDTLQQNKVTYDEFVFAL